MDLINLSWISWEIGKAIDCFYVKFNGDILLHVCMKIYYCFAANTFVPVLVDKPLCNVVLFGNCFYELKCETVGGLCQTKLYIGIMYHLLCKGEFMFVSPLIQDFLSHIHF